ncbi:MAG TPA: hypothetical protein VLC28_13080 [Flavitalea sp.]|nr:hypothetical protein [Flavitalea sp.]
MQIASNDIIASLRKELMQAGGLKTPRREIYRNEALACMNAHFPSGHFPTSGVHEFQSPSPESMAASIGFISALNSLLFSTDAVIAWIASDAALFPPALTAFNLKPHHIICIYPQNIKERTWVIEEALKCKGLNAVIAELKGFDFTQSRRFQLAVEESGVTGFLLNSKPGAAGNNACVGRWKVNSITSNDAEGLPGVGSPTWQVELSKIRNGRKGNWQLTWKDGTLRPIHESPVVYEQPKKWAV